MSYTNLTFGFMAAATNKYCDFSATLTRSVIDGIYNLQYPKFKMQN